MKQTAVEWLANELFKQLTGEPDKISLKEVLEQAKEIEKQQQGYSEQEVENILIEYVKTNPTKPYRVISWFSEFKNK
jgi:hypothetical protein